jgi:hypothetical protein
MSMPHEYFVYMKDLDALKWGYLGYRTSKAGIVEVNFKEYPRGDEPFENGEATLLYGITLNSFLHIDYADRIPMIDGINTHNADEYCVLRWWVYKFLKYDLKTVLKENDE